MAKPVKFVVPNPRGHDTVVLDMDVEAQRISAQAQFAELVGADLPVVAEYEDGTKVVVREFDPDAVEYTVIGRMAGG